MPGNRRPAGHDIPRGCDDLAGVDQHGALQHRRERVDDRVGVQPRHRRIELVEGELVHRLAELGADAAHGVAFVDDEQAVRLADARHDRVDVERHDGAQVDHLALDSLAGETLGRLERAVNELTRPRRW